MLGAGDPNKNPSMPQEAPRLAGELGIPRVSFLLLPLGNKKQAALSLLTYLPGRREENYIISLPLVISLVVFALNASQVSHLIGREPRSQIKAIGQESHGTFFLEQGRISINKMFNVRNKVTDGRRYFY